MKRFLTTIAATAALFGASAAWANPIVTMQRTPEITVLPSGPVDAFDLFYSSTPGATFLNYRLIVVTTNGDFIHDPMRGTGTSGLHWDDVTFATGNGPRVDTWFNTVSSSLGLGIPFVGMTTYDANFPVQTPLPTNKIDWTVFDTNTLDDNDMSAVAGDPGNPEYMAPYHIARILIDSRTIGGEQKPNSLLPLGRIEVRAFDSVSLNSDGTLPIPTNFRFSIEANRLIPEPSTALLALLALCALSRFHQVTL